MDFHPIDAGSVDPRQIRAAVAGKATPLGIEDALYALSRRPDVSDRIVLLDSVLADQRRPDELRYRAAVFLGKIEAPESVAALKRGMRTRAPYLLGATLRSLGRIGDADALRRIARRIPNLKGQPARHARFAATLIAHRLGISGYPAPSPRAELSRLSRRDSQPFLIERAQADEKRALERSIPIEPLGMTVHTERLYRLQCGRRVMMLALNEEVAGSTDIRETLSVSSLVGILLHWHRHQATYVPIHFIMTDPSRGRGRVRVVATNPNGRVVASGTGSMSGDRARFSLRAPLVPGNRPLWIAGVFEQGDLRLSQARVGKRVARRRTAARAAREVAMAEGAPA